MLPPSDSRIFTCVQMALYGPLNVREIFVKKYFSAFSHDTITLEVVNVILKKIEK